MKMLLLFALIALCAMTLDRVAQTRPLPIFRRGFRADVFYVVANILVRVLITNSLAIWATGIGRNTLPPNAVDLLAGQPVWMQAVVIIVVVDFIAYWLHRGKHRFDWWWRLHETHHSSADLDWFSSVRFHPLERLLDRVLFVFPLVFLGATDEALLILAGVDALTASFAHANTTLRYGPLNYLIVSPELHHWHHSAESEHQHTNFGNNLSIFDWIFGTAHLPANGPEELGLRDVEYDQENVLKQLAYPFRRTLTP